jgi:hypothetical protein
MMNVEPFRVAEIYSRDVERLIAVVAANVGENVHRLMIIGDGGGLGLVRDAHISL